MKEKITVEENMSGADMDIVSIWHNKKEMISQYLMKNDFTDGLNALLWISL